MNSSLVTHSYPLPPAFHDGYRMFDRASIEPSTYPLVVLTSHAISWDSMALVQYADGLLTRTATSRTAYRGNS